MEKLSADKRKWMVFQSHPIQYFSPLYELMANEKINVEINYYSQHGLEGEIDKEFQSNVQWDIPLLKGYKYNWLKNYSLSPSIYSFWGCFNPGVITKILKSKNSILMVYGWKYFTDLLVIASGILSRNKLCLRMEMPWKHETQNKRLISRFKLWVLKSIIFPNMDYLLYVGKENRLYYKNLGVPDEKLVYTPYCVDNERFRSTLLRQPDNNFIKNSQEKSGDNCFVFLYSGKLIDKKRPFDLLKAFEMMNSDRVRLIFIGDGPLKQEMVEYISSRNISNVLITGFINQSGISDYYAKADAFVMCSEYGETWGLSTNESMNFKLPLIISDLTGCSNDLVHEGMNGYIYKTGDIEDLASKMKKLLELDNDKREQMGLYSAELVNNYSYETIIENLALVN